jgi:ATP-dependent DNA helicase RecQ
VKAGERRFFLTIWNGMMQHIAFFDTELDPTSRRILDIGCIKDNGSKFHSNSITDFIAFFRGTPFICGHNIFNHDFDHAEDFYV